jgi:dihydroorotate dehydrogenase (fumarate)
MESYREMELIKNDFVAGRIKKVEDEVRKHIGIDLTSFYLDLELKNPLIVAPGPLSQAVFQVERAARAGYGGMVLKSVIGEDKHGNSSMKSLRAKPTFARWVNDEEGNPIYHWNGGLDRRNLSDYIKFAEKAFRKGSELSFPLIPSFLCHLPRKVDEEEWKVEEWTYTVARLGEAASSMYKDQKLIFEIDFCPFLKREKLTVEKNVILRWYRETPRLIKEAWPDSQVIPKLLNLGFGLDFQIEIMMAAKEGGADGIVIANRFFKKYVNLDTKNGYFTAHGGKELRVMNQQQIAKIKKSMNIPVSATGGTYSGKHAYEYLSLGAQNVQLLTFIMKNGFEEVFRNIIFNETNGLLASILKSE